MPTFLGSLNLRSPAQIALVTDTSSGAQHPIMHLRSCLLWRTASRQSVALSGDAWTIDRAMFLYIPYPGRDCVVQKGSFDVVIVP